MQHAAIASPSTARSFASRASRRPFQPVRPSVKASSSTNGSVTASCPKPAETSRTIVSISTEGTLCTISSDGTPLGTPLSYTLTKEGNPLFEITPGSPEYENLKRDPRCSISIQPISFPARAVASVTLIGSVNMGEAQQSLELSKCLYFGGLEKSSNAIEVAAEEFKAAEPDCLRTCAGELVSSWNKDRAEDVYRIVSDFLNVPLMEMTYAELLWVDHLGMYIRVEATGMASSVVRVPFYRPILDERDARSVITMAAQIAWEKERSYNPPSIYSQAAGN